MLQSTISDFCQRRSPPFGRPKLSNRPPAGKVTYVFTYSPITKQNQFKRIVQDDAQARRNALTVRILRFHELWRRDFLGASGLFSIYLKPCSDAAVKRMLNALRIFGMGYSWGGFESLIVPFDCKPTRTATVWNTQDPALRLHIGLEDVEDLKRDLERGFAALRDYA